MLVYAMRLIFCAITTSSATDSARIFFITRPRWTLIVFSAAASSTAICRLSLAEVGLEIQPGLSPEPDVEHDARGEVRHLALHERGRRRERLHLEADGVDQSFQRLEHGVIVVDDVDDAGTGHVSVLDTVTRCAVRVHRPLRPEGVRL